jgi:predicted ribosome quality control (RQC) complex YloA/Tae2 family protein
MKIITENDIKYIIGRNAKDNWDLLDNDTLISQTSLWFHLEDLPGAHVYIIHDEPEAISSATIIRAGQFTKDHSKNAKNSKNFNKVKICYTLKSNLKKGRYTGEVIFRNISLVKYIVI